MEKKKLPGWLYVPLIALLLLVLHQPWKQLSTANEIATTRDLAAVPIESFQKLFDEHTTMTTEAMRNEKPKGDPMTLPRFIRWRHEWDNKVRKYLSLNAHAADAHILQTLFASNTVMDIHARYQVTFGVTVLEVATRKFELEHPLPPPSISADYSQFWPAFFGTYLPLFIISIGWCALYAQRNEMKMAYEWPRIVVSSLIPGAALIVYSKIDKSRQVRSALEFACGFLMLIFSFGTAAGSLAKAQTGPFGGKSRNEETKKKKRKGGFFDGSLTLATGVSSEALGTFSGSVYNGAPNFQNSVKLTLDNGLYVVGTSWKGLDHADPNANLGDWLMGTIGITRKIGATTVTAEGMYLDPAPLQMVRGDYFTVRGTIARALGKDGRYGTLSGTIREMWKDTGKTIDSGTFGYFGYNRTIRVPGISKTPLASSTELRIDPGNLGRGESVGFTSKLEIVLPKVHRWFLRPFIGTQGPLQKERPIKTDNRSWEIFGGFTLNLAPIRI